MITYTWSIKQLERNAVDGGVVTAHWSVLGEEGPYAAAVRNSCSFTPNPADPDFIPYDSLTEADVISWVWDEVNKQSIESIISAKIDKQKTPETLVGVPW